MQDYFRNLPEYESAVAATNNGLAVGDCYLATSGGVYEPGGLYGLQIMRIINQYPAGILSFNDGTKGNTKDVVKEYLFQLPIYASATIAYENGLVVGDWYFEGNPGEFEPPYACPLVIMIQNGE